MLAVKMLYKNRLSAVYYYEVKPLVQKYLFNNAVNVNTRHARNAHAIGTHIETAYALLGF